MSDDAGNRRSGTKTPGVDPDGAPTPTRAPEALPTAASFFSGVATGEDGNSGLLDIKKIQAMARERRILDGAAALHEPDPYAPPARPAALPTASGADENSGLLDIRRLQNLAFERQEETRLAQEALRRAEAERAAAEHRAAEQTRLRALAEAESARLRAEAEAIETARLDMLRAQIEAERRARIELQIAHDLKLAQIQAAANAQRVSTATALTFVAAAIVLVAGAGLFGQTYVESAARSMALEAQDGQHSQSNGGEDQGGAIPSLFSSLSSLFGGGDSDHDRRPSEP